MSHTKPGNFLCKFLILIFIFIVGNSLGINRVNATTVSSDITTDTTWNAAGSPYNLTASRSITGAGTDLIIDASAGPVVITFCNNCYLQVTSGTTLDVNGTASNNVTFKHVSSTSAGAWDAVYVNSGATLTVDYAILIMPKQLSGVVVDPVLSIIVPLALINTVLQYMMPRL